MTSIDNMSTGLQRFNRLLAETTALEGKPPPRLRPLVQEMAEAAERKRAKTEAKKRQAEESRRFQETLERAIADEMSTATGQHVPPDSLVVAVAVDLMLCLLKEIHESGRAPQFDMSFPDDLDGRILNADSLLQIKLAAATL